MGDLGYCKCCSQMWRAARGWGEDSFLPSASLRGDSATHYSSTWAGWVEEKSCPPLVRVKGLRGPFSSEHTWSSASKHMPRNEIHATPHPPMASPNHTSGKGRHLPIQLVTSAWHLISILTANTGKPVTFLTHHHMEGKRINTVQNFWPSTSSPG